MQTASRKRVLVWGLSNNKAGTELVIDAYVGLNLDVDFDFLCYYAPKNYEHLFSERDNRYFLLPVKIKHPFAFNRALREFMKEHGSEYDALWMNVNDISNIDVLKESVKYGIPKRISHVHSKSMPKNLITRLFSAINQKFFLRNTTDRWACSEAAGRFFYKGKSFVVLPNVVDAAKKEFSESKRNEVRRLYGFEHSFVVGTVGRLAEVKNQQMLIRLMPELLKVRPEAVLFLVGDGPEKARLIELAQRLDVISAVVFAGPQEDVQAFLSSFDVFVLPSFYEGLSLALLEAQFNGLPCIVSEGVDEESFISTGVIRASLDDFDAWIKGILEIARGGVYLTSNAARHDLGQAGDSAKKLF